MASFLGTLRTPATTPLSEPAEAELKVTSGKLINVRLYVPPGPRGELNLRLKHRGVQLLPARIGTWFKPDNITIDYKMDYDIMAGDEIFYLEGASPTANFNHTVDFELTVIEPEATVTITGRAGLLGRLQEVMEG